MSFGKIKLRYTDTLFSKYLRKKREYRCEKHDGFYPEGIGLQASHFWGRAKETTRFDEENVDVLCVNCHQYFESHKTEYEAWKKEQMGKKAYDILMIRAHATGHRDDKATLLVLKHLIKEQEELSTPLA